MIITKKGTVVKFSCNCCGCEFLAGIRAAKTPDKGENYYFNCPTCGAECHADVRSRIEGGRTYGTGQEQEDRAETESKC